MHIILFRVRSYFISEAPHSLYLQLVRSAPGGADSAIRFMILGTYMELYLSLEM